MTSIKLKIAELRKEKGIGQQELADVLGVSFQSVSKWETGATMPDIALLPSIAEYFNVSIDELLGLKPLRQQAYMPRGTDDRDSWNEQADRLRKNKKYFWNDDYLSFLLRNVWGIDKPIDVIEFRCGDGFFGAKLLGLLPHGSTYTGVDNGYFVKKAKAGFLSSGLDANFMESDIYSYKTHKKYDLAICQAGLRHMNRPMEALKTMTACVREGGIVACVEVNREFENDGLYFDDIDYEYLCTSFDYHKVWKKELECEGRDYAIGIRLPFYMEQIGLKDIDVRVNDRVFYVNPGTKDYDEMVRDFIEANGWGKPFSVAGRESSIEFFMSRGITRAEAESYVNQQSKIIEYFKNTQTRKSFLKVQGLLITYGRK